MTGVTAPTASRRAEGIDITPIHASDLEEAARILFSSFQALYDFHRFPGAYPTEGVAATVLRGLIDHPKVWGVAARANGRLVGTSFLDERGQVRAIGPVSVDPEIQTRGVGRRLTSALLERARDCPDVRLLQDSFNRASLSLYASLGLEVREPLILIAGRPSASGSGEVQVRPLEAADVDQCGQLCHEVHGFDRTLEVEDALGDPLCEPVVAVREGRLVAYATTLAYFPSAHAVAADDLDMRELILGFAAQTTRPLSFLVPTHQGSLFRWCLSQRMRIIKPMTYMTLGAYSRPTGCWIPSVMY